MISGLPRIGDLLKRRKKVAEDGSIVVDAARKATGGKAKTRIVMTMAVFFTIYSTIAGRLVYLGLQNPDMSGGPQSRVTASRPDIVDRNGEVLATDIKTASLFAEPRRIVDADEAIEKLATVLPEIDYEQTYHKLKSGAGFVWLQRQLTPKQQADIMALGIPGLGFRTEKRRFYPSGETSSYIVGLTNIDNQGISGMEKYIDDQGLTDLQASGLALARDLKPVKLSIDLRVQHVVRDEVATGMERFHAIAAGAVVLNVKTGEVLAMASVPDFDPNNPYNAQDKDRLNRMSAGLYEMGSTFKSFTTAMALDSGKVTLESRFDASRPIRIGRQTIHDFHSKGRVLSVPEVFIYSSNIGSAKEAEAVGIGGHREFLHRLGVLEKMQTELPGASDRTQGLEAGQFDHHRLRPWRFDDAAADGRRLRRLDEWRLSDRADLPAAHGGAGNGSGQEGGQRKDRGIDALSLRAQRREGLGQKRAGSGLSRRRQDRHGRKGRQRSLFPRKEFQRLCRRFPHGRSAIYRADDRRRAEAGKARHGRHRRLECGRHGGQHHQARGFHAWREARFQP